jgi:mRNA interferase YafQ
MNTPIYKNKFNKDVKLLKKRGKDLEKLKFVVSELLSNKPLNKKYIDHPLKGEYSDCRECHIEPDWLLIYIIHNPFITFVRTGTHSDLFKR